MDMSSEIFEKYRPRVSGHALVFGGSGGIGYDVVMALIANGAKEISYTYGKNKAKADELSETLKAVGIPHHYQSLDQTDELAVHDFLQEAVSKNGQEITSIVDAVGKSPNIPIWDQTLDGPDGWIDVYRTNVFGPFIAARAVAKHMKKNCVSGSMAIITSTNGINSQSSISAHYDSSKAAQAMMMRILAEECAPFGLRINGLAPGWVKTAMNNTLPEHERIKESAKIWCGRWAEPHEVAAVAAFLVGSGASYIYGQNIMVDGGYR